MKPITGLKNKWLICSVATILLGTAPFVYGDDAETVLRTDGNIAYVSGGVGDESLGRLAALSSEFNLKLIFAMNSGEYVSGARVVINRLDGKGPSIVDAVADGPWFLTRLPAGTYQVSASLAGKTEKRQITVGAKKLTTVDFRWAAR